MTIVPSPLKKGDKVAIIATARKISIELLEQAESVFRSWDLEPLRGLNLTNKKYHFSGTDQQRQEDLQWAMDDSKIKAVFCFRGGYGTVRILKGLTDDQLVNNSKWIVGYSDITALHLFMQNQVGMASLHGTMPINFNENTPAALSTLRTLLFNEQYELLAPAHHYNRMGTTTGQIIGGNLAIIQSLMGTPYEIDTKDKILFLEDVDEYLYNIDRMMWTLKLSGKLDHLAGLIVGGFTEMKDNDLPFGADAYDSILEKVNEYDYPICFDFPAGHIDDNRAIPFGVTLQLKVEEKGVVLKLR